jgi:hypothetical protein
MNKTNEPPGAVLAPGGSVLAVPMPGVAAGATTSDTVTGQG